MTAVSHRRAPSRATFNELPAELVDQIAEAVTFTPDPHARSSVIANMAAEIFESIRWLHGDEPDSQELASLYPVLREAYAHRARMAARTVGARR